MGKWWIFATAASAPKGEKRKYYEAEYSNPACGRACMVREPLTNDSTPGEGTGL